MKTKIALGVLVSAALIFFAFRTFSPQKSQYPWTQKDLMEPADLASILNNPKAQKPMVFSIGFEGDIKGSIIMGPVKEQANLDKFRAALSKLPKDAAIVYYCGCCPFEHCPNSRPAFKLVKEMGFTNAKLLDLSHNLRADWISKGYPLN